MVEDHLFKACFPLTVAPGSRHGKSIYLGLSRKPFPMDPMTGSGNKSWFGSWIERWTVERFFFLRRLEFLEVYVVVWTGVERKGKERGGREKKGEEEDI
jgi:hypothetical protein